MTLPGDPMGFFRPFLAAASLAALPASAPAEPVTLISPSGLTVSGEFLGYDGEFFRLSTDAGVVTLLGDSLSCEGPGCPGVMIERLGISAVDGSTRRLAAALLRGFAEAKGWPMVETHDARGLVELAMVDGDGVPRLVVGFGAAPGAWQVLRDPRGLPQRGWRDTAIAFDALVPAVSVDNPVAGLTLLGVRAALAGEFPDWVGLGGGEVPVVVHWSDVLEGPLTARYDLAPGPDARIYDDMAGAADGVARTPGGLGLLPLSELGSAVPLVLTGPCGRGALGVAPAIRTGDYPLSEVVVLRHPGVRPGPFARDFLDWLGSAAARAAVARAGFIDLGIGAVPDGRDGRQEADPLPLASGGAATRAAVKADLGDARRLDVAVRFRDGSSLPDRAAAVQIDRLVRAIAAGRFDGQRLILAGFSDANGSAATNLALSRRRAESVRAAIETAAGRDADRVTLVAEGFGEALPVACNGADWGEALNRRVEVWLADGLP